MSDTQLQDTVGDAVVRTTMHPDGDRWVSRVTGGARDGYVSVMDASGDPAELHAAVVAFLNTPIES